MSLRLIAPGDVRDKALRYRLAVPNGQIGCYRFGKSKEFSQTNWADQTKNGVIQGVPTFGDYWTEFLGIDTAQSRLVTPHLETAEFTWIISVFVPLMIGATDLLPLISGSGGSSQAGNGASTGSRLGISATDGDLSVSLAGWNGGISSIPAVMGGGTKELTLGAWNAVCCSANATMVRIESLTEPAKFTQVAIPGGTVRDPSNQQLVIGDNAIANTTYDGPVRLCTADLWNRVLSTEEKAAVKAQISAYGLRGNLIF